MTLSLEIVKKRGGLVKKVKHFSDNRESRIKKIGTKPGKVVDDSTRRKKTF